jgi:hypothetical protein
VDSTVNQVGNISGIVNMVVDYKGHSECIQLAVTWLGKQHIIFGYPWLQRHNPEIKWETKEACMTHCPTGCHTCHNELRVLWQSEKTWATIR